MRKTIGAKSSIIPQPILMVSAYDENDNPTIMTATWGGITNTNEITICIASMRHTLKGILKHGEFVVSMGEVDNYLACDYAGVESGSKAENKFEKSGFHALPAEHVHAPIIEELSFALECKVKSYEPDKWRLVAEIVDVNIDDKILDENGKISLEKFHPIVFDSVNREYHLIGKKIGNSHKDGLVLK